MSLCLLRVRITVHIELIISPIAYTYGLQYVFQRAQASLKHSFLKHFVGTYENNLGLPPVLVSAHKGELQLEQEGGAPITFVPQSEVFVIDVQGTPFEFVKRVKQARTHVLASTSVPGQPARFS